MADGQHSTDAPPRVTSTAGKAPAATRQLGLRANLTQFTLLAVITFGVGLVVGAERVVVPVLAKQDFGVATFLATLSFIVSFSFVKAALNLVAGRWLTGWGASRCWSPAGWSRYRSRS